MGAFARKGTLIPGVALPLTIRLCCDMPDHPSDRRQRPRIETPIEALRRLADALRFLEAEAEAGGLDVAAGAISEAVERVEADIRGRLV